MQKRTKRQQADKLKRDQYIAAIKRERVRRLTNELKTVPLVSGQFKKPLHGNWGVKKMNDKDKKPDNATLNELRELMQQVAKSLEDHRDFVEERKWHIKTKQTLGQVRN